MRKPTIRTKCVANTYAGEGETIAEVFSPATEAHGARGCLICVREVENAGAGHHGLVIEVYRADPGVYVRIKGRDFKAPV